MPGTQWRFAANYCYYSHCVVLTIFIVVAEPEFSSLSPSFPLCLEYLAVECCYFGTCKDTFLCVAFTVFSHASSIFLTQQGCPPCQALQSSAQKPFSELPVLRGLWPHPLLCSCGSVSSGPFRGCCCVETGTGSGWVPQ